MSDQGKYFVKYLRQKLTFFTPKLIFSSSISKLQVLCFGINTYLH